MSNKNFGACNYSEFQYLHVTFNCASYVVENLLIMLTCRRQLDLTFEIMQIVSKEYMF